MESPSIIGLDAVADACQDESLNFLSPKTIDEISGEFVFLMVKLFCFFKYIY